MRPNQFETHELALSGPSQARQGFLSQFVMKLEAFAEHRRQRRALLALNAHMLKDIGLSRGDAERLARQPFSWTSKNATPTR